MNIKNKAQNFFAEKIYGKYKKMQIKNPRFFRGFLFSEDYAPMVPAIPISGWKTLMAMKAITTPMTTRMTGSIIF